MTRTTKRALLLILLFSLMACGQVVEAARVRTVQFKSKLTGKLLPYSVVLPTSYEEQGKEKSSYPTLYLLHGLSGNHSNWFSKTKLTEYAAHYEMIVVTPEGGDGWYTDSATVPADKYESYIMQELLSDVERRYRAVKAREGRAIAGLSMGGYGALKFGVKYPDQFIFAASMSGALDAATRTAANPGFAWDYIRPSIMQTFGEADNQTRADNDLYRLFRAVSTERKGSLPFFYLDCGTEDGFLATNRELATILLERKIPHEFRQLPGGHNWAYWDAQVREVLKLAAKRMIVEYEKTFD
jgi:putative tributyrin esterase